MMVEQDLNAELVIPSYKRVVTLQTTLNQVRTIYPELRICLALQGEAPREFLERTERDPFLRVLQMPTPGTTPALNSAISSSHADVILILDDDAVPHFGWLESHLQAFARDPELSYTAGREVRATKEKSSFSALVRILVEAFFGMFCGRDKMLKGRIVGWTNGMGLIFGNFDRPGTCSINTPRGCNMALRRSSFSENGGFNDRFRGNAWGFEAEFGIRLAKKGRLGKYLGDAIVIHHEVPSGGSRAAGSGWFDDYLFNHRFIIDLLGPQAWIGSLPRLVKQRLLR